MDVVAVNWRTKDILLGECQWGKQTQGRKVVETLIQKTEEVVPQEGNWTVHYAYFTRTPLTRPAQERAAAVGALQISLDIIEQDSWRWMMDMP